MGKANGIVRLTLRPAQCRDEHSPAPLPSDSEWPWSRHDVSSEPPRGIRVILRVKTQGEANCPHTLKDRKSRKLHFKR